MHIKKIGGLRFWRIGRIGGSFYVARRPFPFFTAETVLVDGLLAMFATTLFFG